MIHKIGTIFVTLLIISIVAYIGLTLIRQFAFSIALENHEANMALDDQQENDRKKKIALADQAASDAFRKVEPLITSSQVTNGNKGIGGKPDSSESLLNTKSGNRDLEEGGS
mmetsp:Transcript_26419/g.32591  ORF Transcript_26419/g.32591 Transcript_26419/m.32591 type:complete len:112 (+) Transcript_26419:96-431(+)